MQEASVVGFFKTIVIILGIYTLLKLIGRYVLPLLLKKMVEKAFQQSSNTFNKTHNTQSTQSYSNSKKYKEPTKQVGEYIDYEEIKD